MRSEVYFLPPRTSVTDSVGISTLPIFSCSPNAATRDSSDSLTLRSNPEYEWMMYHFMFGLRGASAVAVAPSAAGWGEVSPPVCASFFSSSGIFGYFFSASVLARFCDLANPEIAKQRGHAFVDNEIDDPEVRGDNQHRDNDHGGRAPHFLPTGRGHLAHFGAHVVVEGFNLLRPGPQLLAKTATGCHD